MEKTSVVPLTTHHEINPGVLISLIVIYLLITVLASTAHAVTPWYSSAGSHILALKPDGTVWAVGSNDYGQLGIVTTIRESHDPVQVPGLTNITAVAAGRMHSVALGQDGTVWTWGYNKYGQLGDGTKADSHIPVQVPGLRNVVAIAAGFRHVAVLKRDGTVWAWGSNYSGQVGKESYEAFTDPVQVSRLEGITAIAAGSFQTAVLKNDGTVWTWGYNGAGQLGTGTRNSYTIPVQVTGLTGIISITAGNNHMVALKKDGTAWAWGSNSESQLGNDTAPGGSLIPLQVTGLNGVRDISAKVNHTFALMQDGSVMAWGDNGSGQWGNGISMNGSTAPVRMRGVSELTSVAAVVNPGTLVTHDRSVVAGGVATGASGNEAAAEIRSEPVNALIALSMP